MMLEHLGVFQTENIFIIIISSSSILLFNLTAVTGFTLHIIT